MIKAITQFEPEQTSWNIYQLQAKLKGRKKWIVVASYNKLDEIGEREINFFGNRRTYDGKHIEELRIAQVKMTRASKPIDAKHVMMWTIKNSITHCIYA